MSHTYKVKVRWWDIVRGKRYGAFGTGGACPVRSAIRRATGEDYYVEYDYVAPLNRRSDMEVASIPGHVSSFIRAFDNTLYRWPRRLFVRPFTFTLHIN